MMLILTSTIFSLGAVAAASPWFLVVLPLIAYAYYQVMQYFRASARELKRLLAISVSPVHQRMAETAEGLVCIRAFGLETYERRQLQLAMDRTNTIEYSQRMANRWMAFRVELLGCGLMAGACALATLAITPGPDKYMAGEAALLALSVSEASGLLEGINWMVQCVCMVEADMARVERLKHYAGIKTEGVLRGTPAATDAYVGVNTARPVLSTGRDHHMDKPRPALPRVPPAGWPSVGSIEFRNVWMRYRKGLPCVLKGVTFQAEAGLKVALVGRTGSGKSSTLQALFRGANLTSGTVLIDGIDTSTIGLRDLRERLAIVP